MLRRAKAVDSADSCGGNQPCARETPDAALTEVSSDWRRVQRRSVGFCAMPPRFRIRSKPKCLGGFGIRRGNPRRLGIAAINTRTVSDAGKFRAATCCALGTLSSRSFGFRKSQLVLGASGPFDRFLTEKPDVKWRWRSCFAPRHQSASFPGAGRCLCHLLRSCLSTRP